MKLTYLLTILLTIAFISCKTDDPSSDDTQQSPPEHFPLTTDSHWTYNNQNEEAGTSRDSVYVAGNQMQNGLLYTNLDATVPASAFMSQFLTNNIVRTTDTQLIIDGSLGAPIEGLPDITLPLSDMKLYDTEVDIAIDPILGFSSGSVIQDIMEIPIVISYSITSTMLETPNTSTESDSQVASELRVNMEIIAMISVGPVTIPVTIMESQDVLIATNIYTDGIGLTNSEVLIEFTLEDLSGLGIELPFPESGSTSSSQTIDTHFIGG
jgi:hypothetical protein